ncbi:fungal-specific transcription factor domain-containing protein [Panaeolus papilionaceus]|nr:fungal-specific transcription factor domain-containing protein [Panaeolus papilionaceus]
MPVDNTRTISSRRTQKALTEEELRDIDRKRTRGELSCAECRRLKLKCDKKLPCSSCLRRGCESICPLGILAAGQGTRFILASTTQLHDKIYEMSNRIRQLEDALAILQSMVSDQRHPLLTDELLRIKFGSEAINAREHPVEQDADEDDDMGAGEGEGREGSKGLSKGKGKEGKAANDVDKSIDALGTLTLGSSGEVQYFGRSAGSETLMMKADEDTPSIPSDDEDDSISQTGQDPQRQHLSSIDRLADLFPFTAKNRRNHTGIALIESFLPTYEQATELCLSYIDHGSLFFRAIKKDELLDELLPLIYKKRNENRSPGAADPSSPESTTDSQSHTQDDDPDPSHNLALLFFVFALGALLDPNRKPFNAEAERYYDLGRAGLSCRSVYESPGVDSVRAMGLMATYCSLAGRRYTRDNAWCVMSFAAKLAQSLGLHRDSARWKLDPVMVQRRRNLFWEVFSSDVSNSLALGRPPAIHLSYVDCEFPSEDIPLSPSGTPEADFWRMKHSFARDIYNSVAQTTLVADSVNYNLVLDLDKKVREISFPVSFNPYVGREVGDKVFYSSSLALRDFYASQHRTVTMIYLHRSFFAQAMLDYPTNPFLSPFAPSFLTAFRCASIIIKASAHLFERSADMALRVWFLMYHTFSAAIIVGTVMTRLPNSNITPIAIRDFDLALSIFERGASSSARAKTALNVLTKLKEKAARISDHLNPKQASSPGSSSSTGKDDKEMFGTMDDLEDDLAIFGGQMKVLDRKKSQAHWAHSPSQQHQQHQPGSTTQSQAQSPQQQQNSSSPKRQQQHKQRTNSSHRRSNSATLALSPSISSPGGASVVSSPVSVGDVSPVVPAAAPGPALTAAMAAMDQNSAGGATQVSGAAATGQGESRGGAWDLGTGLPEVHPSLITYLSQDVVKRALDFEYGKNGAVSSAQSGSGGGNGPPGAATVEGNAFYGMTGTNTGVALGGTSGYPMQQMGGTGGWGNTTLSGHAPVQMQHMPPLYGSAPPNMAVHNAHMMQSNPAAAFYSQPTMIGPRHAMGGVMNTGGATPGSWGGFVPVMQTNHGQNVSGGMSGGGMGGVYGFGAPSPYTGHQAGTMPQGGFGGFVGQSMASNGHGHGNPMMPNIDINMNPMMAYGSNRVQFNAMDPSRAVEMGLASESGMDLGWVTFMQDCGIMDTQEG